MAENNTTKSNGQISVQDAQVAVVMVPLPAQGHLNQLLHLSRLITSYNIPVYYVGATTHIRQVKLRVHGFDPVTTKNLHFHEFPTPPFENPPPNPNASHKFPNHMIPLLYATIHFREPVCSLVNQLLGANHRRVIVIYDSLMTWVLEDIPAIPNAECYRFNGFSAFYMFSSYWKTKGKPFQPETEIFEDIISSENCATPELWELWNKQGALEGKICSGELYNTSRVIEGPYRVSLVHNKETNGLNLWAIGPFNPLLSEQNKDSNKQHQTLYWLDKQETNSVIYVSFGSTTTLSNKEIEELAIGLEKSMQKFIWVLRDADKGDVFAGEERRAQLPEGYEERIKGRGIIERDWAPQLEILAHPSTAWPMHSDQPRNSQLVTKVLKIGLNLRHGARQDELVTSEIVENAVRTLMASPEGGEMRKRASELSVAVKQSVMDGEVEDVPAIPNAECYCFNSISAFHTSSCIWESRGKPLQAGTEIFEGISSNKNCATPELWELWRKQEALMRKVSSGELYNSSRVTEGLYLDLVAKENDGLNQWALGPFNPLLSEQNKNSNKHHQTLYWLDKQVTKSVIYVSFGTTTSLSNEDIEELAVGLEKSMQKFIWVLRDADKGDVFAGEERRAQLPDGYEERLKGRGIIVRDWAPQLEILAHPSTGGFMSHCGWNSCMESISMGVPIAAWPMHSDQPRNSQLVTKFLKIGLIVRHWACRDELVTSEIVENAVRTLMASPKGDEMRKRASELSNVVKQSVVDGGVNREEMDSFITHITR
ncbi:hypothetical protein MTR67_046157 [Solanum verrucosum]|uniref:Glycosyltransferase N-terminal domain-containing protein n=1 Tax=Solanum verrucosum TaxID=315347 RepID=A0AAF0ZUD1_SOLVR|nr:hypothetical protein MTR67_046157 [Solanum verrucosum]